MKVVTDRDGDPLVVFPWVAKRALLSWSEDTKSIGLMRDDGTLAAGVVYNGFMGGCCQMHVAIDGRITRDFLCACFSYPFEQLGLESVIGLVPSGNVDALKFDHHLGFNTKTRIKHGARGGEDLLILELQKKYCRFLGEKYGRRRKSEQTTNT